MTQGLGEFKTLASRKNLSYGLVADAILLRYAAQALSPGSFLSLGPEVLGHLGRDRGVAFTRSRNLWQPQWEITFRNGFEKVADA